MLNQVGEPASETGTCPIRCLFTHKISNYTHKVMLLQQNLQFAQHQTEAFHLCGRDATI